MIIKDRSLTIQEFWEAYRGRRAELWKGVPVEMSPPGFEHGKIALRLGGRLDIFAAEHDLGQAVTESGFQMDDNTLISPDIAFVMRERLDAIPEPERFAPIAPDLAVEIVSPGDRASEIHDKVWLYLESGVRLVWVIYPSRQEVVVHTPDGSAQTLTADNTLAGGELLPGFAVPVRVLFD